MQPYHTETLVSTDNTLTLNKIPFHKGEKVEVIIFPKGKEKSKERNPYPLQGTPFRYDEPFASVAENDWEVLK
ncbi:MAG: hypothetical protein FJ218_08710 [Ignavibacteria bacterium]|nr:hypothetical protein [Ignavibacteria bacterium]